MSITREEVTKAQAGWADTCVQIGKAFTQNEDFKALTEKLMLPLYDYANGQVLFKPTKVREVPFRDSADKALSYFVGGDIAEDGGFLLAPWASITFDNHQIVIQGDSAIAMGEYVFESASDGSFTKVEYTFGYRRDSSGALKIFLHHSSLPFNG